MERRGRKPEAVCCSALSGNWGVVSGEEMKGREPHPTFVKKFKLYSGLWGNMFLLNQFKGLASRSRDEKMNSRTSARESY